MSKELVDAISNELIKFRDYHQGVAAVEDKSIPDHLLREAVASASPTLRRLLDTSQYRASLEEVRAAADTCIEELREANEQLLKQIDSVNKELQTANDTIVEVNTDYADLLEVHLAVTRKLCL